MASSNPYFPANVRLESSKVKIWLLLLIISAIYAIIVLVIITSKNIPDSVMLYTIYSYAIIAPLFTYAIWLLLYHWNAKKWPQNEEMFGERRRYLILFFLMGVCVITWAAYWNTGIFTVWLVIAVFYFAFTGNELGALVIFAVGAYAITPALVEEFNKSLPSILAFFVVLQRGNNSENKRKGMLGNELNGFLIGILIGLAFESIETASYIASTILAGGAPLDVYLQVTLRNWGPIHILGGALGGYAAGKAERLRFELGEENLPVRLQIKKFLKIFIPIWLIPVSLHFLWNSSGVWIYLIFLAINNQNEGTFILAIIITQLGLAVISYIFLCVICSTLIDLKIKEAKFLTEERTTTIYKYCPNCGIAIGPTYNYCTNCGVNFDQLKKKKSIRLKLYEGYTIALLVISIIAGISFIMFSLFIIGPIAWVLFFTQSIYELICAVIIIYAAFTLLKLRKNYNGKKSMWSWLFLVYNLIGMIGALFIMGIFLIINAGISIIIGETQLLLLQLILIPILIFGGINITFFLILMLKNEKNVLSYQRWY